MAAVTKNSKNSKTNLTSSAEPLGIVSYKRAWIISRTLVFKIVKMKKKITAELGQSDLLSIYRSSFAQMPISQ